MFVPSILYPRVLSQSRNFATMRVNWFSPNHSVLEKDLNESNEVFESQNQFAWKVEYFKKDQKKSENERE